MKMENNMQNAIIAECQALQEKLLKKNKSYGNSVADPVRIFSHVDTEEQIHVRIDDKLSRIKRGCEYGDENTDLDIAGYLVLKHAARRLNKDRCEKKLSAPGLFWDEAAAAPPDLSQQDEKDRPASSNPERRSSPPCAHITEHDDLDTARPGIRLIARERRRQIEEEGFSVDRDGRVHKNQELAWAAVCYAAPDRIARLYNNDTDFIAIHAHFSSLDPWPWSKEWDKRKKHSRLRRLAIAGALIAAEIDRILLGMDKEPCSSGNTDDD